MLHLPHLDVMNSMRPLALSSCSALISASMRSVGERWDKVLLPAPRLMLEDVELVLRPESVIGDGWKSGKISCIPVETFNKSTLSWCQAVALQQQQLVAQFTFAHMGKTFAAAQWLSLGWQKRTIKVLVKCWSQYWLKICSNPFCLTLTLITIYF